MELPYSVKYLVLIPAESYLATHCQRHTPDSFTRRCTRHYYSASTIVWIPKGRQLVKKELKRCVTCRKVEWLSFRSVAFSPLPEIRVTGYQPFRVTGVDYAGPLYIRSTKKRSCQSIHLSLYLCSNTSDTCWDRRRSNCKLVFKGLQAIHKQDGRTSSPVGWLMNDRLN